jgi:NADH-quinone oxidoreductase subunit H
MFFVVAGFKSKYATIASGRILLVSILMEVFFALCFLFLYAHTGSYSFEGFVEAGRNGPLWASVPPLALFFFLYTLFEAKRAPFDHSEAESELVAGHQVELGGRALLFFFMCEYVHIYFCMYLILLLSGSALDPISCFSLLPF